jgi:hypothetical protein
LQNKRISISVSKPWEILAKSNFDFELNSVGVLKNELNTNWLSLLNELRTFFQENPDFDEGEK